MRFLVDNAISPVVAAKLNTNGHDALHVRDINMHDASDETVFEKAFSDNRVIISADTDFSFILSGWDKKAPSLILFRKGAERDPLKQIQLLEVNLKDEVLQALEQGSIVILESDKIRIKQLPFGSSSE